MKKIFNLYSILLLASIFMVSACDDEDKDYGDYPEPVITSFSPSEALPGSVVTITGSEFGATRMERVGRVYFGGVEATDYVSWSNNEIQVCVPNGGKSGVIGVRSWTHYTESTQEFTCLAGAEITSIEPSPVYAGQPITLYGNNFQTFIDLGVTAQDITVTFTSESGTLTATADEFTESSITVTVPSDASRGAITVSFGSWQTVSAPDLLLAGDVEIMIPDYVETSGDIVINDKGGWADDYIDSTKNNAYVIYEFTAPATGLFDVTINWGTARDGASLTMIIADDMNSLSTAAGVTHEYENTGSWDRVYEDSFGAFSLKGGTTYYLKIIFNTTTGSWVLNISNILLTLSEDQSQTAVNGDGTSVDYVLYENDFSTSTLYPFSNQWGVAANYIESKNGYLEFHFDSATLAADNQRKNRGCEIICDYHTTTEGWYGFQIYLPEGEFPMDVDNIIISQIFGNGCRNSWAGHLSINNGELWLSHRAALVDPTVGVIGQLETDKWYPVVVYFKAGKNNKGRLKAWLGDNMVESSPVYDSGAVNFGFAHWIDDETLDDTGTNEDCLSYLSSSSYAGYDYLGAKFGLYVNDEEHDMTIRFDDIKALEGNPDGAFDIVKPI